MQDLLLQIENVTEICSQLSSKQFVIEQEFLIQIEEMISASEILKEEYMSIRNILVDDKLSWVEIEKLKYFLADTIPKLWQKDWELTHSKLLETLEPLDKLFCKKKYVVEPYIPGRFHNFQYGYFYFLDGQIFYGLLDCITHIVTFSDNITLNSNNILKEFVSNLTKIFQLVGLIGDITGPYSLIYLPDRENDYPMHPLSYLADLKGLKKKVEKFYKKLLSRELVDLSQRALEGLNDFLNGEKLEKDSFSMQNFFLGPKRGTMPIFALFEVLEKKFNEKRYQ